MKRLFSLCFSIILITLSITHVFAANSVPESVLESTDSVFRILAEYADGYGTGSGFAIKSSSDETLIITNYHVVSEDPYGISVWSERDETISATILAYSKQKDICVLKLSSPLHVNALVFTETPPKQGDAVFAVGFPAAADYLSDEEAHTSEDATITDGIISAVRHTKFIEYGSSADILQINAAINPGNSGGPLFNSNGEVVGINTYGISDSQGIFGAIASNEIESFLEDNHINYQNKNTSGVLLYFGIGIFVVLLLIGGIVVFRVKHKSPKAPVQKILTLRAFMDAYPSGLSVDKAVALLLPAALQIRDLHNNEDVHLEISPESIQITPNGALLDPSTGLESKRYTNGFAAPEVYQGETHGYAADIYSFCAILQYVLSGHIPENSLARQKDNQINVDNEHVADPTINGLIVNGMNLSAELRPRSMDQVIAILLPYHLQPFSSNAESVTSAGKSQKKSHKIPHLRIVIAGIAIVLVVISMCTAYWTAYVHAKDYASNGAFEEADAHLFVKAVTSWHDPQLLEYIHAGQLLEAREYQAAQKEFKALNGYLNSAEMVQECDYRYAAQLADANNFGGAISIYRTLSNRKYQDSTEKYYEVRGRYGKYLLYEQKEYIKAINVFKSLMSEHYAPAQSMLEEAVTVLYPVGQEYYHNDEFEKALKIFEITTPYEDSDSYITLIHYKDFITMCNDWENNDQRYTGCKPLIDILEFEDAADVLLRGGDHTREFLQGYWETSDGEYYLSLESDHHLSYNLPWFDYGDYYGIGNGEIFLYPEDAPLGEQHRTLFKLQVISPDQIQVTCAKDGSTHILYRN